VLHCEATICHQERAAAPTRPPPPSRGQIIVKVDECAPASVSRCFFSEPKEVVDVRPAESERPFGFFHSVRISGQPIDVSWEDGTPPPHRDFKDEGEECQVL